MSDTQDSLARVAPSMYRWDMRKITLPIYTKNEDGKVLAEQNFTIIAKTFCGLAVHPTITIDSDGKGVEYMKGSYSVTAINCRLRLTWARDEIDAFKIAQYLGTMFPDAFRSNIRSVDKVMAYFPNWVAAWIKECRKTGAAKGGYVPPPETTQEINDLLAKYRRDETRNSDR